MCAPLATVLAVSAAASAATGAGLSAAQSASQYRAAKRAARAEAEFLRRQTIQNYDTLNNNRADAKRTTQEGLREHADKALRARERARTLRGEAGVAGRSVDALGRDIEGSAARFRDKTLAGYERQSHGIDQEVERVALGASARAARISEPQVPVDILSNISSGLTHINTARGVIDEYLHPKDPKNQNNAE